MANNNPMLKKIREIIAKNGLGGGVNGKVIIHGKDMPIRVKFETYGACENKEGSVDVYTKVTKLKYPEELGKDIKLIAEDLILDALVNKIPKLDRKKISLKVSFECSSDTEDMDGEEKIINEILNVCSSNDLDPLDTALLLKKILDVLIPSVLKPYDKGVRKLEISMDDESEEKEDVYGYC